MRSLEECKQEIFLRSEQKIRKRRRRMASLISLALMVCIGLGFAAVRIPVILPEKNNTEAASGELVDGEYLPEEGCLESDSSEMAAERAEQLWFTEYTGDSALVRHAESKEVERLLHWMEEQFAEDGKPVSPERIPEEADFEFVFYTQGGGEHIFRLSDCMLYDPAAGQQLLLEEEALAELNAWMREE